MNEFARTLEVLRDADVDFVVIGGVAHTAHGGAHLTYDLDICYDRSPANIQRLAKALESHHPRLRDVPEAVPFHSDAAAISRGMNFTLTTDLGDLDLFGEVAGLGTYAHVLAFSSAIELLSRPCQVLSVEGLVRAKRAAGRPKDLLVLPELEALLEMEPLVKPGTTEGAAALDTSEGGDGQEGS
ncbi:MAG TPA: hypothetical protein VMX16_14105 [Terriglobia bacterium]|nr:hypothetical protein [Terriglobia bacterium]